MDRKEIINILKRQHYGYGLSDGQYSKEHQKLREMTETEDLEKALSDLKQDGVDIETLDPEHGDAALIIKTKNHITSIGANDCGIWLDFHKRIQI